MVTSDMRKQVYDLRPEDLEGCPVWEFASDEETESDQDEATVKPGLELAALNTNELYLASEIVRTDFQAADGSQFIGYCSPSHEDDLGYIQPTIVTTAGQVSFWDGDRQPSAEEEARRYALLGKTTDTLFPLRYKAFRPFNKLHAEGTITGFS